METSSTDLKGITTDINDDNLSSPNSYVDKDEDIVIEQSTENILGIVDDSGVHKVEDRHHDKYIENIRKVAWSSMNFVSIIVKEIVFGIFVEISVSNSSWIDVLVSRRFIAISLHYHSWVVKSEFRIRLREKLVSTKANSPKDTNHIDSH
jgi:hypothetical protein